jgi:Raf kinase inhibitor-like YbhB/YbcL family protein
MGKVAKQQLEVTSPAFRDGAIPARYTADGENISPPLAWQGVPGAKSFAIECEDPDAPSGAFVHWLAWNIDGNANTLPEGFSPSSHVRGVRQGQNGFGHIGYEGPKPPAGRPHRYLFHVYALDRDVTLEPGATRAELDRAIHGHILAEGTVIGRYARPGS